MLAKGFRPFFLGAALFAVAILPLWMASLAGVISVDRYLDATYWHAHELVFGYAAAVIAGFLLTAVGNWTSRETVVGKALGGLALLWLLGRLALALPGVPPLVVAVLDLAFLPALTLGIARPLIATRNRRNYIMLAVLTALWSGNLVMHLDALGVLPGWRVGAARFAVDLLIFLIALLMTRVLPMFTRNGTGAPGIRNVPLLDRLTLLAIGLLVVVDLALSGSALAGVLAGLAALLSFARAFTWGARPALGVPLLFILHAAHAFLWLGLGLRSAATFTAAVPPSAALHALTVGTVGLATLGMMARVALGHSGRPLVIPRSVVLAFALLILGALVRVAGPFAEATYRPSLYLSGTLWTAAFLLYLLSYARILVSPRADGKPG